ncbi:MAG: hypothetical protein J2P31_03785 [Blastocatellia bacterium]|nr:hypothetical protein [Blastocatellia bacterium]
MNFDPAWIVAFTASIKVMGVPQGTHSEPIYGPNRIVGLGFPPLFRCEWGRYKLIGFRPNKNQLATIPA